MRWTKVPGPDLIALAPEQHYIEWHQVRKVGERCVMQHWSLWGVGCEDVLQKISTVP